MPSISEGESRTCTNDVVARAYQESSRGSTTQDAASNPSEKCLHNQKDTNINEQHMGRPRRP
eukprot:10162517-Prorocentrum_lima.AAC.1